MKDDISTQQPSEDADDVCYESALAAQDNIIAVQLDFNKGQRKAAIIGMIISAIVTPFAAGVYFGLFFFPAVVFMTYLTWLVNLGEKRRQLERSLEELRKSSVTEASGEAYGSLRDACELLAKAGDECLKEKVAALLTRVGKITVFQSKYLLSEYAEAIAFARKVILAEAAVGKAGMCSPDLCGAACTRHE